MTALRNSCITLLSHNQCLVWRLAIFKFGPFGEYSGDRFWFMCPYNSFNRFWMGTTFGSVCMWFEFTRFSMQAQWSSKRLWNKCRNNVMLPMPNDLWSTASVALGLWSSLFKWLWMQCWLCIRWVNKSMCPIFTLSCILLRSGMLRPHHQSANQLQLSI